jgi:hypothetical protein
MPEDQPVPDPQMIRAFQNGVIIARQMVKDLPHEQHSDVTVMVYATVSGFYGFLINEKAVLPTNPEDAQKQLSLLIAYGNGFREAYNTSHGTPTNDVDDTKGDAPPALPPKPSDPKDDGMPPMYG